METTTENESAKAIVVAPDEVAQMAVERSMKSALPRCEKAAALLRDFGIKPNTKILHDCVKMSESWEEKEDLTPTYNGLSEQSKWLHEMTTKAVFHDCHNLDAKLDEILKSKLNGLSPREAREITAKFDADVTELKEALIKCFKSNSDEDGIKRSVLRYIEVSKSGSVQAVKDAEELIEFDTSIKVDTPESIASYKAHKKAAEALNNFIDTLINADRLNVVADIQQLFTVDPDTLTVSPTVIDYKLFSEK